MVESTADEPETINEARAQSVLIDSVAEIASFTKNAVTATKEDVEQWGKALFETLFSKYEERFGIAKSPQEKQSLINVMGLMVAVVSMFVTVYYGQVAKNTSDGGTQDMAALRAEIVESRKAQVEELRQIREVLERSSGQEVVPESDKAEYYVVERPIWLLSSRAPKAPKLVELYPNQPVMLIQREHKWIKVRYYDYLSGKTLEGWVRKKYLRQLSE